MRPRATDTSAFAERPAAVRRDGLPSWTARTLDRCLWTLMVVGTTVGAREPEVSLRSAPPL